MKDLETSKAMVDNPLQNAKIQLQEAITLTEAAHYQQSIEVLEGAALVFQQKKDWEAYLQCLNEIGKNYNYLTDAEKAINHLEKALQTAEKHRLQNTYHSIATFNSLGYAYGLQNNPSEEIKSYHSALEVKVHIESTEQKKALAVTYSNIGSFHAQQKNYGKAIEHHKKALQLHLDLSQNTSNDLAICYNNLGTCYSYLGDYDQALPHFQKTLHIWLKILPEAHPHLVYAYNNIASCYHFKHQHELAIQQFEKAYSITSTHFAQNHALNASILSNLGNCYKMLEKFEQAIAYYHQSIDSQKLTAFNVEKYSAIVYENYCNLGNCYAMQQNYKMAFDYFQQALQGYQIVFGEQHPKLAEVLNFWGDAHLQKGEEKAAIILLHQSLNILLPDFQTADVCQYPRLRTDFFSKQLLFALNRKSLSFYRLYKKNQSTKDLHTAFKGYQTLVQFLEVKRQQYKAFDSKLNLGEQLVSIYEKAIEVAVEMGENHIATAFHFTEKAKAVLLMEELQEADALSNIPQEIRLREENLKQNLLDLEKKIEELKGHEAKEKLRKWQNQYFDTQQKYLQLIEQLERDYPDYYQLKHQSQTVAIPALQNHLQTIKVKKTTLSDTSKIVLSYYVGEHFIFIFQITSSDYKVHQIAKPSHFEELVTDFLDAINAVDVDDYLENVEELYELLLQPLQLEKYIFEEKNAAQLTILRHGVLNYLPFDALLLFDENQSIEEEFTELPYLIRYFTIGYHYSATLLLHQAAKKTKNTFLEDSFLGIAPVSFNEKEQSKADMALVSRGGKTKILRSNRAGEKALDNLPSTENEVKAVFELFERRGLEAKIFLYASASKQNLFSEAPKFKYILISTHGLTNDENAKLSGIYLAKASTNTAQSNDSLLYTSETYLLRLQADLVILSSCSSGVGKLYNAEGMMALQRGFLYAGANNVLFTQFDIPDESSSTLVKKLFEYILVGNEYSVALRKAKMDLLVLEDYTPQDWAGFLLIGE